MSAPVTDPAARTQPLAARVVARVLGAVTVLRARLPAFDHLARAGGRYTRMQGDLMAAGVTYFAFLSIFPVVLLVASIIGLVLAGNAVLQVQLVVAIREAVPGETGEFLVRQVRDAISASSVSGLFGLLGLAYAGLRTMDKLRIGVRRVWTGQPVEPDFLKDNLRDVVAFAALGLAGLLSVGITGGATTATPRVLGWLGLEGAPGISLLTTVVGITLALAADTVIFLWLLKVVTHTGIRLRELLPGALFGAVGFEILKVLGTFYLSLISGNVTASTFGGAVGILVWINLVARYAMFTVAWTATLPRLRHRIAAPDPAPAPDSTPESAPDPAPDRDRYSAPAPAPAPDPAPDPDSTPDRAPDSGRDRDAAPPAGSAPEERSPGTPSPPSVARPSRGPSPAGPSPAGPLPSRVAAGLLGLGAALGLLVSRVLLRRGR